MAFSTYYHELTTELKVQGANIAYVRKSNKVGGELSGTKMLQIGLIEDSDVFLYESNETSTNLITVPDIPAIYNSLFVAGLTSLVTDVLLVNTQCVSTLDSNDERVKANVLGSTGIFSFTKSNVVTTTETSSCKWLIPEADYVTFKTNAEDVLTTPVTVGNYLHPNHSGEVTSTGDGATEVSDDVIDEANLKISNAPTDGYVLTAQSGNTGGLTWEATTGTNTQLTEEEVEDFVGGMVTGNTETGITVTYQDYDGTLDFVVDVQSDENFTLTKSDKLDAIESLADKTDSTNVNSAGAVMESDLNGKGELLVGAAQGSPTALAVGTNDYILTADSGETSGVKWAAATGQSDENFTTTLKEKLDAIEPLADVTDSTNVNTAGAVMNSDLNTKGELLVGGQQTPTALAVGTNDYVLTADSNETSGVKWAASTSSACFSSFALLKDEKNTSTGGGATLEKTWQTRDLNTIESDTDSIVTLSNNVFTLGAGTYLINFKSCFYLDYVKGVIGIVNVGGQSDVHLSHACGYQNFSTAQNHWMEGSTVQTFQSSTDLELVMFVTSGSQNGANNNYGMGYKVWDYFDMGGNNEPAYPAEAYNTYSEVQIFKYA